MSGKAPTKSHRSKLTRYALLAACGFAVLAGSLALRNHLGAPQADAESGGFFGFGKSAKEQAVPATIPATQQAAAAPRPVHPAHDIMALVNGKDINRAQLAHACTERYGEDVLESLVNKRLILHHCKKRDIEITQEEVNAEVDRMAKRFKLGREQWLDLLEKERGIGRQEYARDILWPTLALKKLAADQLVVSEQELVKAHEMRFGPAVRARLIVVSDREKALQIQRQLVERPEEFARLAMNESEDINSASIGGMIQPIRRHMGDATIEQTAFAMQPGQISEILPIGEQFAILKCEEHLPEQRIPFEQVRNELAEQIKETKLRKVASTLFADLQESAFIQNVWNDPSLRDRLPGIVATVNGDQITMKELSDECLLRFGTEVLEVEISHLLLQQALREAGMTVEQADIDREITHGALLAGTIDRQGKPDLDEWFRMATEEQGVSKELYLRDSVWPSAALKKLTGDTVQIADEDLRKAYDANYGQRVRCRAIVLHDMRKAMEVWGMARDKPTMEYFSDLAAEYSIEQTSKSLRGEVPPIRRFGGQPQLEEVAFKLQAGELSEIVQMGDRFIILKCEGRTEPIDIQPGEVEHVLRGDITEKKLRLAMSDRYDQIRKQAQIDNYLAGTSQAPAAEKSAKGPQYDTAVQPASGTSPR